jgi:hypothetical protein
LSQTLRWTLVIVAAGLLYWAWVFGSRILSQRPAAGPPARPQQVGPARSPLGAGAAGPKILQFYAYPGLLTEGERAALCYGVAEAAAITIEPGIGAVPPSTNTCLSISPQSDTRYTLTARGHDGASTTASFVLRVRLEPEKLPRILTFVAGQPRKEDDHVVLQLCYRTENASEVSIVPPAFPPTAAPHGCFYVVAHQTTEYTLTAADAKGRRVHKRLTVRVP